MLHTLACSLLVAAATWTAAPVVADDAIEIPYEVEADGTVPFVDLSGVSELPATTPSRTLLGLTASSKSGSWNYGGYSGGHSGGSAPKHSTTHSRSSSSVTCVASASSNSFSASKNAHATAVAVAVKKGCAAGKFSKKWRKKVAYDFEVKAGYAIAEAWASAATACKSKGNAAGCAKAKAVATAWAKATFSANAVAFAKALNKCKHCKGKYQIAKAEAYGFASEFEKVVLEVEAIAESQTCVAGNASAGNKVFAKCVQVVYAEAFAKAVAKALISGKCGWYYGRTKIDADALIAAKAVIDKWEYTKC